MLFQVCWVLKRPDQISNMSEERQLFHGLSCRLGFRLRRLTGQSNWTTACSLRRPIFAKFSLSLSPVTVTRRWGEYQQWCRCASGAIWRPVDVGQSSLFLLAQSKPPSTHPWNTVLGGVLCWETCPNQTSFRCSTVENRGPVPGNRPDRQLNCLQSHLFSFHAGNSEAFKLQCLNPLCLGQRGPRFAAYSMMGTTRDLYNLNLVLKLILLQFLLSLAIAAVATVTFTGSLRQTWNWKLLVVSWARPSPPVLFREVPMVVVNQL